MAEPATATLSPAMSPSSEPPSGTHSPTAGGTQRLLFTHDLVSGKHRGAMRFGLVRMIHGEEDFEDSDSEIDCDGGGRGRGGSGGRGGGAPGNSDNESGAADTRSWPLGREFVRVQWYPEGTKQDIRETQLKLEDRSIVPRDFVRRMNSNDKQCGIVTNINTKCAVKLVGTNCVLYPVNSKDLQHVWSFMYGDYIVYDFWLGKVYDLSIQIVVKLSNGARCSMSEEDGAKLYDIYPHVSDVGLFFDDAYGFYPGQVLIGPSKVFANVQWLYGVKPVLSKKSKFRVVVEEVQVVELKVTWITKSYSPKGSDSVFPPPSTITQENLCRVKRLGYFDHTQRQLGERSLYVFPAKSETTRITCEGPEGAPAHPEDPVVRKLKRMFRKEVGKKIPENADSQSNNSQSTEKTESIEGEKRSVQEQDCSDDNYVPCYPNNGPVPCQDALEEGKEPPLDGLQGQWAHLGDQDSDEDPGDDTDDTSSVTSSASSTASLQSGPTRKKSIPLSIRNLKRKHKKKRTKFSREFKPGDRVAVEVVSTVTSADVMWKDGKLETGICSNDLIPIQHLDNHEFCPGDYVLDKRPQALHDPGIYGVVQSGDHKARTCVVKWVKLNAAGDNVEVIGEEEDVSVYDIADHPDFHFHTTDIVIRIGNSDTEDCENERSVGQVCRVDLSSKVEVVWADNSKTIVLPQHLYNVESEIEETYYDSAEGSSSGASSEEWEDESDSWETDNGQVEEEPGGGETFPVSSPNTGVTSDCKTHGVHASTTTDSPGAVSTPELPGGGVAAPEDKPSKETPPRGFRELKEALKILESLKNMTVEQLWTGSPTSPTAEPSAATAATTPADAKPTKEKRFLDDIKKLQENLKKTLDNVAIVEEDKMEAAIEEERVMAPVLAEPQTPVRSEWPSDTPVLCQQSGGKPGVTFTSAKGEVFSVLEWAPDTHSFKKMEFQPAEAKKFFSTVRKEMALLATSLPDGIMVKTFEDRMDLFSAFIKGPNRTPYEDGLFLFDIQLPNIYPAVPPLFRYLSQCSGRLNPNLYDNGKVCVSLLGTWIGKGTERWTSKSSLLQVLISIQGLILVNEPYYNEAGFDSDRGLQEGYENSRCYNEMALIKMVQSMTLLLQQPVEVFQQEICEHFACNGWRLVHRLESWLDMDGGVTDRASRCGVGSFHAEPLEEIPSALAHSSPSKQVVRREEELEDSGLSPSTVGPSLPPGSAGQQDLSQNSDCDSSVVCGAGSEIPEGFEGVSGFVTSQSVKPCQESQPAVRPKKRRKSYRSFLPERSGYPDIGFPLFPLSKGFVKSMRVVLQQYRATLTAAGVPEYPENK
ncbi:(E3-independent) E2 ubiquitin-conjugating enzyme UBE2O-like [Pimephales promelas]|uniref:(E3-independent) E2 ubiquitin-conjugating enzyme UBE2O-like n=1 Tax=Pimephales promelas TaxID=90988 RepID=UPI001955B59B|nr:(E3-independent) E2 ubiquitin-conjugating enzyme UBE2O-like [Pimephales promelas]KAG1960364.1 (E3-independent) E2 ubiquitin-conjugating enzyme [Pimephales promelas]